MSCRHNVTEGLLRACYHGRVDVQYALIGKALCEALTRIRQFEGNIAIDCSESTLNMTDHDRLNSDQLV